VRGRGGVREEGRGEGTHIIDIKIFQSSLEVSTEGWVGIVHQSVGQGGRGRGRGGKSALV
jgi:hypothetical protein